MDKRIQEIEEELANPDFLSLQKNGLLLNNHQLQILEKNNIAWQEHSTMKSLIFYIEEIILEEENEELERLSQELQEFSYYHETRK